MVLVCWHLVMVDVCGGWGWSYRTAGGYGGHPRGAGGVGVLDPFLRCKVGRGES
jgi:hypothetical protein